MFLVRCVKTFIRRQTYNHGLPGRGKVPAATTNSKWKKELLKIEGEIIFGVFPVLLSLKANKRTFNKLYIKDSLRKRLSDDRNCASDGESSLNEILTLAASKSIPVKWSSKQQLDILSQARPHQGFCCEVSALEFEPLHSLVSSAKGIQIWTVLDSVQDPMNFGSIIRSAFFLGVDELFVVKKNSCKITPVVSKASAGAVELKSIYEIDDLIAFLAEYKDRGWNILGTTCQNSKAVQSIHDIDIDRNTILVIGNEGVGLSDNVLQQCDWLVNVKSGRDATVIDSLNVSVAAGILMDSLCRQSRHRTADSCDT